MTKYWQLNLLRYLGTHCKDDTCDMIWVSKLKVEELHSSGTVTLLQPPPITGWLLWEYVLKGL
jgi:hypothetical protein